MKKLYFVTALAAALQINAINGFADDRFTEDANTAEINTLKGGATFGAASIIGGLLAGPIGFMIGGISGTVLAEELDKADRYETTQAELETTQHTLAGLEIEQVALKQQLSVARQQQSALYDQVVDGLTFQVLFYTGEDTLTDSATTSLDQLVTFLKKYPQLELRLHGYADPRGTDEYNNVLAMHRAITVQQALEARGINSDRIQRYSYGSDQSIAIKGDLDAYAMERRVTIEVISQDTNMAVIEPLPGSKGNTLESSW